MPSYYQTFYANCSASRKKGDFEKFLKKLTISGNFWIGSIKYASVHIFQDPFLDNKNVTLLQFHVFQLLAHIHLFTLKSRCLLFESLFYTLIHQISRRIKISSSSWCSTYQTMSLNMYRTSCLGLGFTVFCSYQKKTLCTSMVFLGCFKIFYSPNFTNITSWLVNIVIRQRYIPV